MTRPELDATGVAGMDWASHGAAALIAGEASAAASYLRRAVTSTPENVDVLGNLAVSAQHLGNDRMAAVWLRRLLGVESQDEAALVALALVGQDLPTRLIAAQRALALNPSYDEAWIRIGTLVLDAAPARSLRAFWRAAARTPKGVAALVGSALAIGRLGRRDQSATVLRRAAALIPDRVDAWEGLADSSVSKVADAWRLPAAARSVAIDRWRGSGWHRLAGCYWQAQRVADACRCYRVALALVPPLVEAMANLGAGLRETGDGSQSRPWFERAVALAPDSAGAMTNLGTALAPGTSEARRWHRRALAWEPGHVHALNNLGSQELARNATPRAQVWFNRAIDAGYPDAEALWNRGVTRLVAGDLLGGFADYEHRWGLRVFAGWRRPFTEPLWKGEPAAGRTILAHAEQGVGDTLQFARYLAPLAGRGFRVILECQPALRRLLADVPGASAVVAKGDPLPPFDLHVPLLSLPQRFGTTLPTIPAEVPYLHVEGRRARSASGRRIGLVWAGNPQHRNDANRSLDAAALDRLFAGLAGIPDLTVVSLQVGGQADGLSRAARQGLAIEDLGSGFRDFADTAAVIRDLDLVIGVDTSVMHLTGALGRPGWLLLPFAPDWRWLLGRKDTPWYPTFSLYRQATAGTWADVVDAVLGELRSGR